jgi:hypothetical protein
MIIKVLDAKLLVRTADIKDNSHYYL